MGGSAAPGPEAPGLDHGLRALWGADVHRLAGRSTWLDLVHQLRTDRTARPIFTARLCQATSRAGAAAALRHALFRRAHRWATARAGMDLPWETPIGPGLAIAHGWGLVVSPDARIGSNVTLFHGVTIGRKDDLSPDGSRVVGGAPTIGDGVWIGPHAVVVGAITVGDGARIGPGAVLTKDVPPRSLVVGNPGTVIATDVAPDTPNPAPLDAGQPGRTRRPKAARRLVAARRSIVRNRS
jgi:serine O-acetyltransferase